MSIIVRFPNIVGECSDKNFQGCVDANLIKWGSSRAISSNTSTRGDRESSNASITDLTLYKFMDKATAALFLTACCGTGQDIEIYLTKTGTGQGADVYMVYTLKNAIISHYSVQASGKKTGRPSEKIVISFVGLQIRYTPYDENGNMSAPIAVGFDTSTNTKI